MKYYSTYLLNQDFSIENLKNVVRAAFCSNRCLTDYVQNVQWEESKQNNFTNFMVVLGRMDEDMNSIGDALLQSSGLRQKFLGLKEEIPVYSFPGFRSFLSGFKEVVKNVNGAINIISQIGKETEKFIDKICDLEASNTGDDEKIGPIGMFNLEAAGRMLQDAVKSNSAMHKRINAGYFHHFKQIQKMQEQYLPLCMDVVQFAEKLYTIQFEYFDRLNPPNGSALKMAESYKIFEPYQRISTRILLNISNSTSCENFIPGDSP